jgi:hypothetical protein
MNKLACIGSAKNRQIVMMDTTVQLTYFKPILVVHPQSFFLAPMLPTPW